MTKYLVTGGTGFLGKHLIDRLVANSNTVRIFDSRPLKEGIEQWKNEVEFIQGDIRNQSAVAEAVKGMDGVFHLAAIPSIAQANRNTYNEINVDGTRNVLKTAKAFGVKKALYVSSSTVYGIPSNYPLIEEDNLNPIGHYGSSKIDAECIAIELTNSNFHVNIIRPRVIMGPGRIGIFGILFSRIIENKRIYLVGNGENYFQFTNVGDMVDACIRAIDYNGSEIFNIGAEKMGTVKEDLTKLIIHANSSSVLTPLPAKLVQFAMRVTGLLGIAPLENEQFLIADKNFKLNTKKAQNLLNWIPKKSNFETILEAFEWYYKNINTIKNQYKSIMGILGRFRHSQQGGFQSSSSNTKVK